MKYTCPRCGFSWDVTWEHGPKVRCPIEHDYESWETGSGRRRHVICNAVMVPGEEVEAQHRRPAPPYEPPVDEGRMW